MFDDIWLTGMAFEGENLNIEDRKEASDEGTGISGELRGLGDVPADVVEDVLLTGMDRLTDDQQEIIRLRHQEKLAFVAIASHLNCSTQSAEQMWHEAIEALAKYI